MKEKLKKYIQEEKGAMYTDVVIGIMILMMAFSVYLNVMPVFSLQNKLNHFVKEVLRTAELSGRIDSEVQGEIARQKNITGIDPVITFSKSGDIALGEEIMVTGELTVTVGTPFLGSFPFTIRVDASGRSEVYHK